MKAFGIDIGGTTIKAGLCSDGRIVDRLVADSPRDPEKMADVVIELMDKLGHGMTGIASGIAVPGAVSSDGKVYADNLGWQRGVKFGEIMVERGCRTTIINDASAALLAEWKVGALKGITHGLMITFGTGIGSGVIIDGKPYDGVDGRGIELGHIITHANGSKCTCGQRGCWEVYASAGSLVKRYGMTFKELLEARKEQKCLKEWDRYMKDIAIGLCSCLSAYTPERLVLGGGPTAAGDDFYLPVMEALHATPGYDRLYRNIEIKLAELGNDAGMIGAALSAN